MRHYRHPFSLWLPLLLALGSTQPIHAEEESDRCLLVPENGPCKALIEKFYFEQEEQRCTAYYYDGCGPVVPFDTLEACQMQCEASSESSNIASPSGGGQ